MVRPVSVRSTRVFLLAPLLACAGTFAAARALSQLMPRDYGGVNVRVPGIFVTPVPNAPFSAKVDIVSQQKLADGTTDVRTSTAHVARQSSGRIYNELREQVPLGFQGDPQLISSLIYDPATHLSTFLSPLTHLAHERVLKQAPAPPPGSTPTSTGASVTDPRLKEEALGTQLVGAVELRGIRKTRTIPAEQSGTGKQLVVIDEYWYSADLSIYMIIKHNDPRTGEQIVAVSDVSRAEPQASLFEVPAKYRVVDETPVE